MGVPLYPVGSGNRPQSKLCIPASLIATGVITMLLSTVTPASQDSSNIVGRIVGTAGSVLCILAGLSCCFVKIGWRERVVETQEPEQGPVQEVRQKTEYGTLNA